MLRLKGLSGFCLVIVTIGGLLCVAPDSGGTVRTGNSRG